MTSRVKQEQKTRFGVIGAGWVARARHLPGLARDKRVQVTAVFDRDARKAEGVAAKLGATPYTDLAAFLAHRMDAVTVCSPPFAHADHSMAALTAGMHVLVEKPMALTTADAKEIAELAARKGLLLAPAHNFLFSRSMRRARRLVDAGALGQFRFAFALQASSVRRRLPAWIQELPGGIFQDEVPHLLYLLKEFTGELEVDTSWHTRFEGGPEGRIGRAEARLRGQRGDAYLSMWSGAPVSEWLVAAHFDEGILVIDLFRDLCIRLKPERNHRPAEIVRTVSSATIQLWSGVLRTALAVAGGDQLFGHDRLIRNFVDAITGQSKLLVDAQSGIEVVRLSEAVLPPAPGRSPR